MLANLVWQHSSNLPWVAGLLALALAWQVRGYWRSPMRGWPRLAACGAKSLAWTIIALCALDPVWTRTQPQRGANEIVLMADTSASMQLPSQLPGKSRAEALKASLGEPMNRPSWWNEVEDTFRLRLTGAGDRLRTLSELQTDEFQEPRTRIATSLSTLGSENRPGNLAAIVLFTDGGATDEAEWKPGNTPDVPVFPVILGKRLPDPDLSLVDTTITQTPFEDSPVVIQALVSAVGFKDKSVTLAIVDADDRILASQKQVAASNDDSLSIRLEVPGIAPGVQFRRLVVAESDRIGDVLKSNEAASDSEITLSNNVRRLCIDRGQGPYRILYISGRPNWEYKFLRRSLHADPEIQMPALIRIAKREPKFEWRGRTGETSNPLFRGFGADGAEAQRYDQPVLVRLETRDAEELADGFPKTASDLFGEYRAIIIDDLEASFFTVEQMRLVEDFVSRRGGALLMLGGQESFQNGGYEHTPIGQILPAYVDPRRNAEPIESARFDLTREGWLEPWTRLHPDRAADESRLANMPEFQAANRIDAIKPGASLLASIRAPDGKDYPAILAHRFGSGRVASVPVADLWRWGMVTEEARADMEQAWRQLIRWLVVDVEDRVNVSLPAADSSQPSARRLQVRVRDTAFRPQDNALVRVEVSRVDDPDGKPQTLFAEPSLEEAGLFSAEYFANEPGDYRAAVAIESAEDTPVGKSTGWTYDPLPDELRNTRPDTEFMARVAEATGGEVLSIETLDRLPGLLADLDVPVEETLATPLWHSPWVFSAVMMCLGAEWYLRRRFGWI